MAYSPSKNSTAIVDQFDNEIVESNLTDGSEDILSGYSLSIPDDELCDAIDDAIKNGSTMHDKMKQIQDINDIYYRGEQTVDEEEDYFDIDDKVRPIENRIFLSIETLIPIVTNRTPEPVLFTDSDNKEEVDALAKVLVGKYEEDNVRSEVRIATRNWSLYRLGLLKLVYDAQMEDFTTKHVRPQRCLFDPVGLTMHEMKYVIELISEPLGEVLTKFPDKKKEILAHLGLMGDNTDMNTEVNYWEFWTNEIVCWKLGSIILEKSLNVFFDFETPENNFLRVPTKPYSELNRVFSLGNSIYDDTSLAEQVRSMQDGIDSIYKNVMEDLGDRGSLAATGDGISKEELAKIRNGTDDKLWFEGGTDIRQVMQRIDPKSVNPLSMPLKQEMSNQSDNIMGTHGSSRGEQGSQETYRGRQLLKDQDTGRTQPISDAIERMMTRVYGLWVQAIKVLWTDEKAVTYTDDKGANEIIRFKGDQIHPGMKLRIKPGSLLPKDKFVERNEALELLGAGRIDDETLYEKLGDPNPKERAKKVYIQNAVISGQIMQPGFLDVSQILFPGIKQEIMQQLQEGGADPMMMMSMMGMQPPMGPEGQPQGGPQGAPQVMPGEPVGPSEQGPNDLPPINDMPVGLR